MNADLNPIPVVKESLTVQSDWVDVDGKEVVKTGIFIRRCTQMDADSVSRKNICANLRIEMVLKGIMEEVGV